MLLQAKKEFAICADLRPNDVFFYYSQPTCLPGLFILHANVPPHSHHVRLLLVSLFKHVQPLM